MQPNRVGDFLSKPGCDRDRPLLGFPVIRCLRVQRKRPGVGGRICEKRLQECTVDLVCAGGCIQTPDVIGQRAVDPTILLLQRHGRGPDAPL